MKILHMAFAAAITLPAAQAHAADTGGYLFAGAGQSRYNEDCSGVNDCETTATASRFLGGYRFSKSLAGEVLVLDFGKIGGNSGGVSVDLKATAVGAGVALLADLSPNWRGALRLGVAQVKVKANGRFGGISVSDADTSTQAYFGLGLGYAFTDTVSLEFAFDGTQGKYGGQKESISAWTVGLGVRF
jgi:opacity protein-like surface antigen